jgi:hypothetical protein
MHVINNLDRPTGTAQGVEMPRSSTLSEMACKHCKGLSVINPLLCAKQTQLRQLANSTVNVGCTVTNSGLQRKLADDVLT